MPQRIVWTQQADFELLRLRRDGATWDTIARRLAVGRNSAVERGLALLRGNAGAMPPARALAPAIPARPRPTDRPPLPPGHPVAWAVLTERTALAGSAYPYPVFA